MVTELVIPVLSPALALAFKHAQIATHEIVFILDTISRLPFLDLPHHIFNLPKAAGRGGK
jgi:hypothetical protein